MHIKVTERRCIVRLAGEGMGYHPTNTFLVSVLEDDLITSQVFTSPPTQVQLEAFKRDILKQLKPEDALTASFGFRLLLGKQCLHCKGPLEFTTTTATI